MKTVKVWDLSVRIFHWALVLLVGAAFLTAEDETISWHVRGGIAIAGLLGFRLIWGLVGPEQARFRSFVRGPRAVLEYLRDYVRGRPPLHLSHNPLGAVMVVALLLVLFGAVITGVLTYSGSEWNGWLSASIGKGLGHDLEELHEALANSLLLLVPAHVIGVIVSSFLEKQNLIKGMITGRKRAVEPGVVVEALRLPRFLAAATAGIAVALGLVALLLPDAAKADLSSAAALIRSLEASARAGDPLFEGFSAADGQQLYAAEFTTEGKQASCSTCHGEDPRQPAGPRGERRWTRSLP